MNSAAGAPIPRREVAVYPYHDRDGTLLYDVVRYIMADGSRSFAQRRPSGVAAAGTGSLPPGEIVWGLRWGLYLRRPSAPVWTAAHNGAPGAVYCEECLRVPYRLPEVLRNNTIFTAEGEPDVETLEDLGLCATTNPGGSGGGHLWAGWAEKYFHGKFICHVYDNDQPGRKHVLEKARALASVVAEQGIVDLPGVTGVKDGGDVTDWIALGHTKEELDALMKAAPALTSAGLAELAQRWGVSDAREEPPKTEQGAPRRDDAAFTFTPLRDLFNEPEEQTPWVVEGMLPTGGTSITVAKPKDGKSTFVRCLGAQVARGEKFFGRATVQGPVLYIALEEIRGKVREHFRLLGLTGDEPLHVHAEKAPAQALLAAQRAIALYQPVLVIIDPLQKFSRIKDTNDYAQVTAALEPVLDLARKSGAHLLCVHHAGKTDKPNPVDAALGSIGFSGGVDTILVYKRTERGYRTLQTTQRYGEDLPETVIEWNAERKEVSLGAERSQAESARIKAKILEILSHQKPGSVLTLTEDQICGSVEGKNSIKRMALRELLKSGQVTRERGGKRGDPYHYKLASPEPEPEEEL